MRSNGTYRSTRRNEAREMLRKVRAQGKKATFREAWADAQTNWSRHKPLPKVKQRPVVPAGKVYAINGKREVAR